MANKITTRVGSLILQYGPGAMLNEEGFSFLIMDPSNWKDSKRKIFDERLQRVLDVDYFAYPEGKFPLNIFPRWFSCTSCRCFLPYESWKKTRGGELICPNCGHRGKMIPARFVAICRKGHLDDVDWNAFVHRGKVCSSPKLILSDRGADSLSSLSIKCEHCGAKRSLSNLINTKGDEKMKCSGASPWRCLCNREDCNQDVKVVHRGSSSVYFPKIITSLVIPPFSSKLFALVEEKVADLKSMLRQTPEIYKKQIFEGLVAQIIAEHNLNEEAAKPALMKILETALGGGIKDQDIANFSYDEYLALSGQTPEDEYPKDFYREIVPTELYHLNFLSCITLIHSIREVRALVGFSRVLPLTSGIESALQESGESTNGNDEVERVDFRTRIGRQTFYPGYQVRGEGIFFSVNYDMVSSHFDTPGWIERFQHLERNFDKSLLKPVEGSKVDRVYLFLHSLSHALIKELANDCGYEISSIRERIYNFPEKKECGIFIYTAEGDVEGTLGGLVRRGRPDMFTNCLKRAISAIKICSSDPICSLSSGQGRDLLNLSACHNCLLLPETSCESNNVLLDRATLVGTLFDPKLGFFYQKIHPYAEGETTLNRRGKKDVKVTLSERGLKLPTETSELVAELSSGAEDEEKAFLKRLSANLPKKLPESEEAGMLTVGAKSFHFRAYWPDRRVVYLEEQPESYFDIKDLLTNAGYFVFRGVDPESNPEIMAKLLGEK